MISSCRILFFLFPLTLTTSTSFLGSHCPPSFPSIGDICVRAFLTPLEQSKAQISCAQKGAVLVDTRNERDTEDAAEYIQLLRGRGVLESTWLVAAVDGEESRGIRIGEDGNYTIVSLSPSAAYPFLCQLTHSGRRQLTFQQQLVPSGAPRLLSYAPSELFFPPSSSPSSPSSLQDVIALPCSVEANPMAQIQWYRNEILLIAPSSSNKSYLLSGGTLLIPSDPSLAYSTFHCIAYNVHGKIRGPSTLLRPAFLDPFPSSIRHDTIPLANGGAKLNCHPPNHQPKSHSFSWLIDSSEHVLSPSSRVFVSYDGSLLFSYVTPDDDHKYACSLSLPSTQSGHYGPFFRLRVSGSQPPFAPRLSGPPQIFSDTAIVGDTVYLECFAYGNPIPVYKWTRTDGRPIADDRVTMSNHGRTLRIEGLRRSDTGRYRCTATNAIGADSAELTLMPRVSPSVLVPLADSVVSTSSSFSLECPLATGDASSNVEWFKNAQPIVPLLMPPQQRKRFRVSNGRLLVSSAVSSDSAVYQCIITNDVGVATSSALISVHDSAPEFPTMAMPVVVEAAIGSTVSFPCIHRSSPRGSSFWTDGGGTRLRERGRVRERNGTLEIHNVLADDGGLFYCTVTNKIGTAHMQVELRVKPAVLPSPECSSAVGCTEEECRRMSHRKHLRFKVHSHHTNSVYSKQKHQKISLPSLSPSPICPIGPSPPSSIRVDEVNEGIRISWRSANSHRDIREKTDDGVKGHLIEMRTRSNRGWRAVERADLVEEREEAAVLRLNQNTMYQFRVRPVGVTSVGGASAPTGWIRTRESTPRGTVEDLKWRTLGGGTVLVEWKAPEGEVSPDNLRYEVKWREAVEEKENTMEVSAPFAMVRVGDSAACRTLSLSVRALNEIGPAHETATTAAFVGGNGSMYSVRALSAVAVNASHVNITWTKEGESLCNMPQAIMLRCTSFAGSEVEVSVEAEGRDSWMIGGLEASTQYLCTASTVDMMGNVGETSAAEAVEVRTLETPPTEAPTITRLILRPLDEDSAYTTVLEWSAIPLSSNNSTENIMGYKIHIFVSSSSTDPVILSMPLSRLSDPTSPSARLDGLRLMFMYNIQVAGYNEGGMGPLSPPRSVRLGTTSSLESSSPLPLQYTMTLLVGLLYPLL